MKSLGAMRLHAGEAYIAEVLQGICPHVDSMLFMLDVPNEPLLNLVEKHCAVPYKVERVAHVWTSLKSVAGRKLSNSTSLDILLHCIDRERPDLVLIFDEDEIPPQRLGEELRAFEESSDTYLMFRYFITWGDLDHVRDTFDYRMAWHCKAFKWKPGLSFMPNYLGRCIPTGFDSADERHCPYPLRHTPFTTPEMRRKRKEERGPSIFERRRLSTRPILYDSNERWDRFLERPTDETPG